MKAILYNGCCPIWEGPFRYVKAWTTQWIDYPYLGCCYSDLQHYCQISSSASQLFDTTAKSNHEKSISASDVDPDKFEKNNKMICGHLLNHMKDSLFDMFVVQKSANIIWILWSSDMASMMLAESSTLSVSDCSFRCRMIN